MQRHIYGYQGNNIQIFADDSSLAINPSYIQSWLDFLSRTPRVAPFLSKNDPFVMALKKPLDKSQVAGFRGIFSFDILELYIWCANMIEVRAIWF
nr:hypothetical protein CFP56_79512 [Quercus suber]